MKLITRRVNKPDAVLGEVPANSGVYLETSKGTFYVRENKDGSLSIHETTYFHLVILPKTSNGIELRADHPTDFDKR